MQQPLLEVKDLVTELHTDEGTVRAVDGVSFALNDGETLGIVGESGCGKSILSLSTMKLLPRSTGRIASGTVRLRRSESDTIDITTLDRDSRQMQKLRGNEISIIFQEPMTSLNPVYTIGHQITEALQLHQGLHGQSARRRAIELLEQVKISDPGKRVDQYPFELSGGMRQRAMIAMALSCEPKILIADEPTTALDVTIEAEIIDLIKVLQQELGMAVIFITHNLGVIARIAHRIMVMYSGKAVEIGTTEQILTNPAHPYTKGLLQSIPQIGRRERLHTIPGTVPNPFRLPKGCYFAPRCKWAMDRCAEYPPSFDVEYGHQTQCWLHEDVEEGQRDEHTSARS